MIKTLLIACVLLTLVTPALACKLPPRSRLTVGCAYGCDFIYRFRLRLSALVMGYPVDFVNMRHFSDSRLAMNSVDAILIPGGADINPSFYLDSVTPELADYTRSNLHLVNFSKEGEYRDEFEYDLVTSYSEDSQFEKLPMLGICRGMQMMSVAQGIPLSLDIKTELG
jgi:gamma-glutamyl-gamma-aminobutyrate hydrolase PuuD